MKKDNKDIVYAYVVRPEKDLKVLSNLKHGDILKFEMMPISREQILNPKQAQIKAIETQEKGIFEANKDFFGDFGFTLDYLVKAGHIRKLEILKEWDFTIYPPMQPNAWYFIKTPIEEILKNFGIED